MITFSNIYYVYGVLEKYFHNTYRKAVNIMHVLLS